MSSEAQIAANQANAQFSSGPKTTAGKAVSSRNRLSHGLAGAFVLLKNERRSEYENLLTSLQAEYQPQTPTEELLVTSMAQHHWLSQRALDLETTCFDPDSGICDLPEKLAVYLRYQTTHERSFHKCLKDLLKLQAARSRGEIGFESYARQADKKSVAEAAENRREAAEKRKSEMHEVRLAAAKARLSNSAMAPVHRETTHSESSLHAPLASAIPASESCALERAASDPFGLAANCIVEVQ